MARPARGARRRTGSPRSFSPIRSATTSAGPRTCSSGSPVEAVLDPRIPAASEDETTALAAARERGVPVRHRAGRQRVPARAHSASACSGPTEIRPPAATRTTPRSSCSPRTARSTRCSRPTPRATSPCRSVRLRSRSSRSPTTARPIHVTAGAAGAPPSPARRRLGRQRERLRPPDAGDDGRARRRSGPRRVPHRRGRARDDRDRRRAGSRSRTEG